MTPIPDRPDHITESMYRKCGHIIVDDFIYHIDDDGWGEWRCDKCENFGGGLLTGNEHPDQLYLWEIPFEQTDAYRFAYFMAQQHYEWCHKGEYKTWNDDVTPSPEFQKILDDAYHEAALEHDQALDEIWFPTEPVSTWTRFKAYFGFESYHGKHRREDFQDMPAVREVERQWRTWHQSVVSEYRHYSLDKWQGRMCFQSDIQLARGYYPFKRKKHRK